MTYALIVPVLCNFEGFTKLMQSIHEPCTVIVVDNYVNNRGVAAGWNYGLKKAQKLGYDKFVVSNDDIIVTEGQPSLLVNNLKDNDFVMSSEGFALFALTQNCIDQVGYFDENFWPAYWEDGDYHVRIKRAGIRETVNTNLKIDHKRSSTQFFYGEEKRIVSHEQFQRNGDYFKAKWGGGWNDFNYYEKPFNGQPQEKFIHLANKRPEIP